MCVVTEIILSLCLSVSPYLSLSSPLISLTLVPSQPHLRPRSAYSSRSPYHRYRDTSPPISPSCLSDLSVSVLDPAFTIGEMIVYIIPPPVFLSLSLFLSLRNWGGDHIHFLCTASVRSYPEAKAVAAVAFGPHTG